jgi:hypothetical protein
MPEPGAPVPSLIRHLRSAVTPPAVPRRKIPVSLLVGAKIVLAGALLYFVLSKINISEAEKRLTTAQPSALAEASILALAIPVALALRWWVLARPVISWPDALASHGSAAFTA